MDSEWRTLSAGCLTLIDGYVFTEIRFRPNSHAASLRDLHSTFRQQIYLKGNDMMRRQRFSPGALRILLLGLSPWPWWNALRQTSHLRELFTALNERGVE